MNKRILVVDDDKDILEVLKYVLAEYGYNTVSLSSGEQIFEVIQEFNPDLVLMDVMLADMDGRAICRNIKEKPETAKLPVILISGTHDLAQTLHQQGAPNDFLAKPFDIDCLLSKIELQLAA